MVLDDSDTLGVDAALAGVSKSVMLARKIKVLGDIKYDPNPNPTYAQGLMTTQHGVVGYDSDMFFKYCHSGSPLYDSSIDFNQILIRNSLSQAGSHEAIIIIMRC